LFLPSSYLVLTREGAFAPSLHMPPFPPPPQAVQGDLGLAALVQVLEEAGGDVPSTLDGAGGRLRALAELPPAAVAALASQDGLRVTGENDVLVGMGEGGGC
jgi:hypothetical protein